MAARQSASGSDTRKLAEIKEGVREAYRHFSRIDILVNNAGIGAPNPAEKVTEKDFDDTVAVNLKGTFFVSQAVGALMMEQKSGAIINIGSQAGAIALPTESIYCMTKAAISHLTKCLALEWAKYNIRVNAVAPTFIRTDGTKRWLEDADFRESVIRKFPWGGWETQWKLRRLWSSFLLRRIPHHRGHAPHRRRLDDPVERAGTRHAPRPGLSHRGRGLLG